jgi:hypothetical protein
MRFKATIAALAAAAALAGVGTATGAVTTGTPRGETLNGTARADVIRAGAGADTVNGDRGNDRVYGGPGADVLVGGLGQDRLYGNAGNDRVRVRDNAKDVISCGPGRDTVTADLLDKISSDCESVARPPVPAPVPPKPGTTRETALPIGTSVTLDGGWSTYVASVTPDATAAVLAENQFNSPPAAGRQFFIARVVATYLGAGSARFDGGFRLRVVGPSAVSYSTFSDSCGVIPDDLPDPDVFTGGTIQGNVCWSVPSTDAGALVMYDDPFALSSQRYYFRLF